MDQRGFRIYGLDTSFSIQPAGQDNLRLSHSNQQIALSKPIPKEEPTVSHRETIPFKQTTSKKPLSASECKQALTTVRLRDLMPILLDAADCGRAWVRDFGDDPITISQDLYEVLLAYQSLRRAA